MQSGTWAAGQVGRWTADEAGLPCFRLTALGDDCASGEGDDPPFILGNHGITVFAHATGHYQLHSGQRSWARLNWSGDRRRGACTASLSVDGTTHDLLSWSGAAVDGGCGQVCYHHVVDDLRIVRRLSVPPSRHCGERRPLLHIALEVENGGQVTRQLTWHEGLCVRYDFSFRHNFPFTKERVRYPVTGRVDGDHGWAQIRAEADGPLITAAAGEPAWQESQPPCVHVRACSPDTRVCSEQIDAQAVALRADTAVTLAPGERLCLVVVVGYDHGDLDWQALVDAALIDAKDGFRAAWAEQLPTWTDDADPQLAQEMRWHAYVLQAMATWSDWYGETFIPQGTVYEYGLGCAAVIRDHLQHAMPLCWCDPELAASILRYAGKHSDPWGHIRKGDEGANQHPLGADQKSDSQIYALYTLAEYLRAGNAPTLLTEEIHFLASPRRTDLLDCAGRWLRFLRDEVSVGPHGWVRLCCSDWNDCFYDYFSDLSYHRIFGQGESGLNTAMAIVALGRLADALAGVSLPGREQDLADLQAACRAYRQELLDALLAVLGESTFLTRAFVGKRSLGADELYFEPQPHLLAIPELADRHAAIWQAIRERVYDDEPRGARQRERAGMREDGGIWYALNGPLVDALAAFDPGAAGEALEKLTCRRHAATYPGRWIGMWSNGDSLHSHQLDDERRGRVASYLHTMPVFCAHAHAWPLHGWLVLRQRTDGRSRST